jgi:Bacterial antitoxin of type II TA system, VapB
MKTTLEISDPLLRDARKIAAREGTTLRALVEQGLRQVVASKKKPTTPFRLRDVSFKGRGLQPELRDASWERILDISYGYPCE